MSQPITEQSTIIDSFKDIFNEFLQKLQSHNVLIILVSSILILYIMWYIFRQNTIEDNKETVETNESPSELTSSDNEELSGGEVLPRCTLYYANWCGHCKVLKPTWQKLIESDKYNGKVNFEEVESDENPDKIQQNKIEGFPTIKLKKQNETKEYSGNRTLEDLEEFLDNNI